jgi:transposase
MSPSQEVVMRPPEVFVREPSPEEGARLKQVSKRAKYQATRQRAMIVLASATMMSAPEIARLMRTDESHVRKVIHAFNDEGLGSLDPDYRGGRPKKTTPRERDRIVALARARPDTQGVPLTRWSLSKLAPHLAGMGMLLSREALRMLRIDAGLSHLGPGSTSTSGVRYLFAAYDVHADRLHGRLRKHKNADEVLAFFKQIRMRYPPKLRIYLVMDNLSTHKTDKVHEWAESNNVELVFTPTYASFLNRIECHFWAIGEFVVKNADYPNWDTLTKAMAEHIRYRNGPHRDHRLIQAERRLLIAA